MLSNSGIFNMKKIIFLPFLFLIFFNAVAQTSNDDALASQYFQDGEYEKAVQLYQKLFNNNRTDIYYEQYFNTLIKLKQYDEAEKLVKSQIKNSPENYAYQVDYGKILQERGEFEKLKNWYDDLIKNVPKNELAITDLANNLYKAQAAEYAIKTFVAGRKLLNNPSAFTFDLLNIYRLQNNKEMLMQEFLNILATDQQMLTQAKSMLGRSFQDSTDYDMLKTNLLRRLQKNPQNLAYEQLLSWLYIQEKEFDLAMKQTIALDKRLKEEGDRVYELVELLLANKAYSTAIDGLKYIIDKGNENNYYVIARVQLLNAENQMLIAGKYTLPDLLRLEKDYISLLDEFGRTANTSFAILQLANLQAFYLNKPGDAKKLLEDLLQTPGLRLEIIAQTKLELGDVYIIAGEEWEAALIYGQVEKQFANEPLGQEAKYKSAKLSYYQGEFQWAKAQLDVLKSSTSELFANDALNLALLIEENAMTLADTNALKSYAHADFLIFKSQFAPAISILDSINIKYPSNLLADDILMAKARIYIKQNEIQKAVDQLQKIIDNYQFDLWADDAVFMLAELYEKKLNDPVKAKSLYEKIIQDFSGSLYIIEARKRFRNLRGDKI
jgi:tetratricopeptide (TPR) repeat protein